MRRNIRPYRPEDEIATADVWHRSGQATYTYLPTWQAFTLDAARQVFQAVIVPNCDRISLAALNKATSSDLV